MNTTENVAKKVDFYRSFIEKGDIVYDVGANIGNRIDGFLNIGARVIAFEPQKDCQKILNEKFGNKITSLRMGLGAKSGFKKLYISNANTISSLSKDWIESVQKTRFKDYRWDKGSYIRITTIDKMIQKHGFPKFIKIDVEGYEIEVLKGLNKIVPYISYEYCTPENTQGALRCLNYLAYLNPNIECNFSVGESMELNLKKWIIHEEMLKIIGSKEFSSTQFGDIYIKN